MKVLVATTESQGERETDYNWTVEGELVWIQEPCATDMRRLPQACGCGRGFAGLASHRATSTAKVVDQPELSVADFTTAIRTSIGDGGWPPEWAEIIAQDLLDFAAAWEVGTVVERDIWVFEARHGSATEGGTLLSWVVPIA
jgi:hypothetical protein